MGTIADKLQATMRSKLALKAALEAKGLEPTDALSTYAGLISGLGGSEFFDGKGVTEVLDINLGNMAGICTVDSNGNIYACLSDDSDNPDDPGYLKKFSPDGTVLWSVVLSYPYEAVLSVDEQSVYVRTDFNIHKVSASTGTELWTSTAHTKYTRCVAVATDGYVYSADMGGNIKKLNPQNGAQVWTVNHSSGWPIDMITAGNDGSIFATVWNYIIKVDPSGYIAYEKTIELDNVSGLVVTSDGYVYIIGYSYETEYCAIAVFAEKYLGYVKEIQLPYIIGNMPTLYMCADADGYLYVSSTGDNELCKVSSGGDIVWRLVISLYTRGIAVDSGGHIYMRYSNDDYIGHIKKFKQSFGTLYLAETPKVPLNALGVTFDSVVINGVTYEKCIVQCVEVKV